MTKDDNFLKLIESGSVDLFLEKKEKIVEAASKITKQQIILFKEEELFKLGDVISSQKFSPLVQFYYLYHANILCKETPNLGDGVSRSKKYVEFKFTRNHTPRFLQIRPYENIDFYWFVVKENIKSPTKHFILKHSEILYEIDCGATRSHGTAESTKNNKSIEYTIELNNEDQINRWNKKYKKNFKEVVEMLNA